MEGLAGRQRERIVGHRLGHECCQTELLEHVEVVVACGPVGAETDLQPRLEHLRDGREPARDLQVA